MKKRKLLIAYGNPTLLVWNTPFSLRENVIKNNLGDVEQVGFITQKNLLPSLEMMGNELCVNATIALAKLLGKKGFLYTSGIKKKVSFTNRGSLTSIVLPINFSINKNIVILSGIGFIYLDKQPTKDFLKSFATKFKLPAFGAITFTKNTFQPYVYVKNTNSLFKETACGSGSVALHLLTGIEDIIQPSGGLITVQRNKNEFTISAKVNELPLRKTQKNDTLMETTI